MKHKTELRKVKTTYEKSFCIQKGCRFYGQEAKQGICHTDPDTYSNWNLVDRHLDLADKHGEAFLKEIKATYKGKNLEYIKYLEDLVVIHWSQEVCHLDELIGLRRRNSLLKDKVKRLQKKIETCSLTPICLQNRQL